MSKFVLAYDIGTTGVKTCLFEIDKSIRLVCATSEKYPLYIMPNGGAEQDGDDWWMAMAKSTKQLFTLEEVKGKVTPNDIAGISFCSQMQSLILVDKDGVPVHRPMSYMDQRAKEEIKEGIAYGAQIAGANVNILIQSLIITGAVSSSVKDPIWKYKWLEKNEPENFERAVCWLDVKDYLISRCTNVFAMTEDSAFATLLYDTRKGKEGWSKKLCDIFNIKTKLLPKIIKSTDIVGKLTDKAANELGLVAGIPVFGGGGDSSLIGVGAGCVNVGDTHIYSGTSGWVITVTDKQMVDVTSMIAAITGAQSGKFNYFAEMETAGKSIEWAKDSIILGDDETSPDNIYEILAEKIKNIPAGCNGLVFTPWLHGNRCPFEDPDSTGIFFGLKLETTKEEMFKSVVEGVFYHLRWMLECQDSKIKTADKVRFVGGSALSPLFCQMLADILGRTIETVDSPQNVGSVGAAAVMAVGLKLAPTLEDVASLIPVNKTYEPNKEIHKQYENYFETFKRLYKTNKKLFKLVKGEKVEDEE